MRGSDRGCSSRRGALGLATALLVAAVLSGCGPGAPEIDLMPTLSRGAFVAYGRPVALGRIARQGDFPDSSSWAPLPITAGDGWLAPGRAGWRPLGGRAVLEHHTWGEAPEGPRTLRLALRHVKRDGTMQRLEVRVDGTTVGEVELAHGLENYYFSAPGIVSAMEANAGGETIELLFDPPLERLPRALPVTLAGFALADEMTAHGRLRMEATPPIDESGRRLTFSESGRLVATLPPYSAARALRLELRCPEGEARLGLSILDDDDEERFGTELAECDDRWNDHELPIEGSPSGFHTLTLDVRLAAPGARLEMRAVGLDAASGLEDSPEGGGEPPGETGETTSTGAPVTTSSERPDIVVIILDAARAAHFGYAGYERDTTPHIDALAGEGLVFERAYSECPNTACSIPNLITGVPFLDVGTVFQGRKVPDELTTLAEYLKPLGYRTVGFSANPNNSPSRNSHQGFDRFERLWGAHIQTELAAEVIAAQPADEPLYLQLHLLPPHQPYKPEPEFDLFTDPDYEGPVHPKIGLRRYTAGFVSFTPEDLEQLIALYDGNLRMADDAVSLVFEALERAGRWERSLVLLTADHGEAFGEHGDFQHNSTLFDEMLHVPFVLRLPGGEIPAGVDTRSNVALADVVPTLLGYLGLAPRPEVWGVDLLSRPAGGQPARPLFHRTSHRQRWLLGIRTERWKAITGRNVRRPGLFDLASDRRELTNLAARRPALFSGLVLRLRDFVEYADLRMPRSTEEVELEPEEVELLRSLGYVQ